MHSTFKFFRRLAAIAAACVVHGAWAQGDSARPSVAVPPAVTQEVLSVPTKPLSSTEIQFQLIECRELLQGDFGAMITKAFDVCFERLKTAIQGVLSEGTQLSASEKRTQIFLAESILEAVRRITTQLQTDDKLTTSLVYPIQASLATIENLLLRYLSIVHAKETWDASIGFGLGIASFYDSFREPQLYMRGAFSFDLGHAFDGTFNFSTASSRYEYTSFLSLPVREVNWFTISEALVRWKKYQRFIFKLGRFPDTPSLSTPSQWPFTSIMGDIVMSQISWFGLTFSIRHDKFGTFIPERNEPTAAVVERTLTQLHHNSRFNLGNIGRLNIETIGRFHWYADPEQQLTALSLGRARKIGDRATTGSTDYRVFQTSLKINADLNEKYGLSVSGEADVLRNTALRHSNNSYLLGASIMATWRQVLTARVETYRAILQCAAVPPLALEPHLIPGFAFNGVALRGAYRMTPTLEFASVLRMQGMVRRLTGVDCSQVAAVEGDLQHLFFAFITSYYFSN